MSAPYLPAGSRTSECACGGLIVAYSAPDIPRAVLEHQNLDPQHILWRRRMGIDYPEHVRFLRIDAYEGRLECQ